MSFDVTRQLFCDMNMRALRFLSSSLPAHQDTRLESGLVTRVASDNRKLFRFFFIGQVFWEYAAARHVRNDEYTSK